MKVVQLCRGNDHLSAADKNKLLEVPLSGGDLQQARPHRCRSTASVSAREKAFASQLFDHVRRDAISSRSLRLHSKDQTLIQTSMRADLQN